MGRKKRKTISSEGYLPDDNDAPARFHLTDTLSVIILFLLVLVFFFPVINSGKVFFAGDVMSVYNPYQSINAEGLKDGEFRLWTDRFFCGFPLLAESQGALLYPPTTLAYSLVPVQNAFTLDALFHFFLAGLFMYILARSLGQRPLAALLAGSAFAFSGLFCSLIINFTIFRSAIWIPIIFYLYRRSLRDKGMLWPVLLSLSMVMQMMGGSLQVTGITLLLLAIDGIYMLVIRFIGGAFILTLKRMLKIIFVIAMAVGIYAYQLLPTMELMPLSHRGADASYEVAASYSFPTEHLVDFIIPNFFGDPEKSVSVPGSTPAPNFFAYIGVIALGLAIYGAGSRRTGIFLPVALLFVLLALGPAGRIFDVVYHTIPFFDKFRAPDRFLMVFVFCATLMAGFGAEKIASRDDPVEDDEDEYDDEDDESYEDHPARGKYIVQLILCVAIAILGILPWLGDAGRTLFDGIMLKTLAGPSGIDIGPESLEKYEQWRGWVPYVILYFVSFAVAIPLCNLIIGRSLSGRGLVILFLVLNCLDLYLIAGTNHNSKLIDGTFFSKAERHMPKSAAYILEHAPESRIYAFGRINYSLELIGDVPGIATDADYERLRIWYQGGGGKDEDYFRLREILVPNLSAYYGLYDAGGFASLFTEDWSLFEGQIISQMEDIYLGNKIPDVLPNGKPQHLLIDTMAAEYIISGVPLHETGRFSLVHDEDVRIYKNLMALPRAYIVHPARVLPIKEEYLHGLAEGGMSLNDFDFETWIIMPTGVDVETVTEAQAGISTDVKLLEVEPEHIKLEINPEQPGVLVLADAYYPGWEALLDGEPAEIHRANLYFRGLVIDEPGYHTVEFNFNPSSFRTGKTISIISLILLIGVAILLHIVRDRFEGDETGYEDDPGAVSGVRYGLFGRKIEYELDDEDE